MKPYLIHRTIPTRRANKGYTVLTFALSAFVIIGFVGIAVDVGRAYIAKSEAQVFADSASIAAALELNGQPSGLDRARAQVAANSNKWNFNTSPFATITTTFAQSLSGPWEQFPSTSSGYMYAKASVSVDVPVFFMGMFRAGTPVAQGAGLITVSPPTFTMPVRAEAIAGQEVKTTFSEGLFPFSPYAHSTVGPAYGLTPGQLYTFRWPANPKINNNVCPGDNDAATIALAGAGGGSERGYIEENSANTIRQAIGGTYQTVTRSIGDTVNMTGGAKNTERTAILNRISTDTNSTASNYATYLASGTGNGQRVVAMPINSGAPDYTIVQIGAFFLLPASDYGQGGNTEWCAEYVGAYVQGGGAGGTTGNAGAYVVRLVK